jgi:hypothetical protein
MCVDANPLSVDVCNVNVPLHCDLHGGVNHPAFKLRGRPSSSDWRELRYYVSKNCIRSGCMSSRRVTWSKSMTGKYSQIDSSIQYRMQTSNPHHHKLCSTYLAIALRSGTCDMRTVWHLFITGYNDIFLIIRITLHTSGHHMMITCYELNKKKFAERKTECTVWQWYKYDELKLFNANSICLAIAVDGKECGRKIAAPSLKKWKCLAAKHLATAPSAPAACNHS